MKRRNPRPIQLDLNWIDLATEKIAKALEDIVKAKRRSSPRALKLGNFHKIIPFPQLGGDSPSYNQREQKAKGITLVSDNRAKSSKGTERFIVGGSASNFKVKLKINGTIPLSSWEKIFKSPKTLKRLKQEIKRILIHEISHTKERKVARVVDRREDYSGYYNHPHEVKSRQSEIITALRDAFLFGDPKRTKDYVSILESYPFDTAVQLIPELHFINWKKLNTENEELLLVTIYQWLLENGIKLRRKQLKKWELPLTLDPRFVFDFRDLLILLRERFDDPLQFGLEVLKDKKLSISKAFVFLISPKGFEIGKQAFSYPHKGWFEPTRILMQIRKFEEQTKSKPLIFLYIAGNIYELEDAKDIKSFDYLGHYKGIRPKRKRPLHRGRKKSRSRK